jgi:hypothetical protein
MVREKRSLQAETPKLPEIRKEDLSKVELPPEKRIRRSDHKKCIDIASPEARATPAKIARPRVEQKTPPKGKQHYPHGHKNATPEPKKRTPEMRVREYPDEGLVDRVSESGHYLYCGYCLTDVGLRSCTIDAHIKTTKHLQKKRNSFLRRPDLQSIENTIKEWQNNGERMPGASLPIRELIFQFRVTRALMISGIPRARLHDDYSELKLLLEEEKFPLPHSAIDRMITPVINQERARLRSELDGLEQASIIFDGATEVGEVFSTVIRFVDEMCNIRQRLLSMSWLKQHGFGPDGSSNL